MGCTMPMAGREWWLTSVCMRCADRYCLRLLCSLLKVRELVKPGDLVVVVSDIRNPGQDGVVRSASIRHVPSD